MHKQTLSLLLIAIVMMAIAGCDRGTAIKKSVTYHDNTMLIKVYVRIDGREVQDFKKEYNVAGLDKAERDAMSKRILDSLSAPDDTGK